MTNFESTTEDSQDRVPIVRFLLGAKLLGQTPLIIGETIVEHAISAGVEIPTNCTSGTCGTCMITLSLGDIPVPETLPPGLDDYLIDNNARLGCIGCPVSECDIDIRPPL